MNIYWIELFVLIVVPLFVVSYRQQSEANANGEANSNGKSALSHMGETIAKLYNKYAPYSFAEVQEKTKQLGHAYTVKEYTSEVILIGGLFAVIGWMYFYSIPFALFYAIIAIMFIPYLHFLKANREFAEFIFEQIQTYCSNVINEFNTTQSFVKSLEGCRDSGILEDPVLSDVSKMIDMSYANGTIDEAIEWFNKKYPYYMVKNMHQLFNQITKEGAQDTGESLENMMSDIDTLVEGVYRDKMDRSASHKKFLGFGVALYFLPMLIQVLMKDSYKQMIDQLYIQFMLHAVVGINSYFIISGEKFYNEDTGVE